jgi:hypothetical protein
VSSFLRIGCAVGLFGSVGCASSTYHYGRFRPATAEPPPILADHGEPDQVLDGMAAVVDAPGRLIGSSSRREISPETATQLATYLEKNDLGDVHLSVNRYDPSGEWRRLRTNTRIGPVWRYTAGALSVAGYAVLPGRVFGTNRYNPFTDTLSVNSDKPVELLKEAAEAKDVRSQRLPGTYAAMTSVPGLAVVREVRSANDVLSYARAEGDWDTEKAGYRELYPRVWTNGTFGTGPLVTAGLAWWAGPAIGLGGAVVGGGIGYVVAAQREAEVTRVTTEAGPPKE